MIDALVKLDVLFNVLDIQLLLGLSELRVLRLSLVNSDGFCIKPGKLSFCYGYSLVQLLKVAVDDAELHLVVISDTVKPVTAGLD